MSKFIIKSVNWGRKMIKNEEKIEILKTLANIHRDQFNQRRKYDIQIILGTLGVDTFLTIAKLSGQINFHKPYWLTCVISFSLIALVIFSSIYLYHINKANGINKEIAETAEDALMRMSMESGYYKFLSREKRKTKG